MSLAAMQAAVAAVDAYLQPQAERRRDENLITVSIGFAVRDAAQALTPAGPLADEHGATVTLRFGTDLGDLVLVREPGAPGFRSEGTRVVDVIEALKDAEEPAWWTAESLRPAVPELDAADPATGAVVVSKAGWKAGLPDLEGRTVWVGPALAGFTGWIQGLGSPATQLFADGPGLVLTLDGPEPAKAAGPSLTFARPGAAVPAPPGDERLRGMLEQLGRSGDLGRWRMALVSASAPVPDELVRRLRGHATVAAASLIAEARDRAGLAPLPGLVAPLGRWELDPVPVDLAERDGDAVRRLCAWVAAGATETHLRVAATIAASRIDAPLGATPAPPMLQAAEQAYAVVIDQTVRTALEQQEEFEKTFLSIDQKVAEMRAVIAAGVDQVVTRSLTAALALAIAALASPRVRGTPAAIAGALIVLYLLLNALALHRSTRREAQERLDDVESQLLSRRAGLGTELARALGSRLPGWRSQITSRVTTGILTLALLALGVAVAAYVGAQADGGDPGTTTCQCTVTTGG